jgi:hypothetical protein
MCLNQAILEDQYGSNLFNYRGASVLHVVQYNIVDVWSRRGIQGLQQESFDVCYVVESYLASVSDWVNSIILFT